MWGSFVPREHLGRLEDSFACYEWGWGRLMYYVWMPDKDAGKCSFAIMGMGPGEAEMGNPVSYFLAL